MLRAIGEPMKLIRAIDQLLRGHYTRADDLRSGRLEVPVRTLVQLGLLLGAGYGVFMGLFAVLRGGAGSWLQLFAAVVKVPLLFLLTLCVTFPSLYAFSALNQSSLRFAPLLRLMLVAIAIDLAVLASLGPVLGFFTLSTDSYPFMIVLNVAIFAIAGCISLGLLRRATETIFAAPPPEPAEVERTRSSAAQQRSRTVLNVWVIVYGVVGAQMGWILRPFIGAPGKPFEWFRDRDSNFLLALLQTLHNLFH
jgi:hypothetical protein